ncbi:aminoglycoside phosphotransferase family protein [Salinicola avicenniae]|uniref:aminoglycoside phosphotransferase family protein n=1 Tax=Salinicola avicenniae TaxID=2916836 RepID=UPI002073246A|nr:MULTISPECIES: phosphotransferase [unclassified Salinicola]
MNSRLETLRAWIAGHHRLSPEACRLQSVAGDASLRSYWRVAFPDGTTRILMDAPPALEESRPFVEIGQAWHDAGLPVPAIHAVDLDQGFLELDDLGDDSLHHHFDSDSGAHDGTARALALLDDIQCRAPTHRLPPYTSAFLDEEMERFPDWGLTRWLGIETPESWPRVKQHLLARIAELPSVTVHRDFDAMNLMIHDDALWIIDFQGALAGPLGYDLVSLLRGRYHRWTPAEMAGWIEAFRQRSVASGALSPSLDSERFRAAVEAIGAQRQLKILGQFCRLCLRDGKSGYLERLPHFYQHLDEGLAALPALAEFRQWLQTVYRPAMEARLASATDEAPGPASDDAPGTASDDAPGTAS